MNSKQDYVTALCQFIDQSPSQFHATRSIEDLLVESGFAKLDETSHWNLKPAKKYYVTRNDSAIIAFVTAKKPSPEAGFNIATAHTDSPAPKLKLKGASFTANTIRIPVETYGGDLHSTWFDRPLGIAGRIAYKAEDDTIQSKLVNIQKPIAIIPSLAIHLNRNANASNEINVQQHMAACLAGQKFEQVNETIAKEAGLEPSQILDAELFLYDCQQATRLGVDDSLVSAPRLDNLAACHALTLAISKAKPTKHTQVAIFTDNEEIGSRTPQGAHSTFINTILDRITLAFSDNLENTFIARANSTLLSIDAAHAVHPNYADKHDPAYAPQINKGIVIKANADAKYATNAVTAANFRNLCAQNGFPVQDFINRSDMPCGSTIGPITAANLGCQGLDIGAPLWAMHSARETAGALDHKIMIEATRIFLANRG